MKGLFRPALLLTPLLILIPAHASAQGEAIRPPAQYKASGRFAGGSHATPLIVSGIRFGSQEDGRATRMVLDLHSYTPHSGDRSPAPAHPPYSIELHTFPYRLVIRLGNTYFDPGLPVGNRPALPFSVVADESGLIREMQVFLPGPSEFKVIEIDNPAKLSIDVRPLPEAEIPDVYTVQLVGSLTPEEAYALVERRQFPPDFTPSVLVLGKVVVVEQAYADMPTAARVDASLRELGYSTVINERRGNELPQP